MVNLPYPKSCCITIPFMHAHLKYSNTVSIYASLKEKLFGAYFSVPQHCLQHPVMVNCFVQSHVQKTAMYPV
jgi:hypothetical protein